MPAPAMFAKFKNTPAAPLPSIIANNPISQHFDIGSIRATAGPEQVWKIYDAFRKTDGKEVSMFIFEKKSVDKLHKPKRKEAIAELLRGSVRQLERFRHPKMLQVLHGPEECGDTLAFVSEPVLGSLGNILTYHESLTSSQTGSGNNPNPARPPQACEYHFLDIELKYGLLQVIEALSFLHYSCHVLHRNVCPSSIIITKKGTWKMAGLEFTERMNDADGLELISIQPWTNRLPKVTQPDLDYIAPEVQQQSVCNILSDMFSLGLVMCAIFNQGRALIQTNHSPSSYAKQHEVLEEQVRNILPRIPVPLQEAAIRLTSKETRQRPTAHLLALIKYFSDPVVQALQFLDVINMKDPSGKSNFYRNTLKDALPYIPRKLWFQHVWPSLQQEMKAQEVLAAVLQPIFYLIQECTLEEYESLILPNFRWVFSTPKSIQATVTLLENLHIILEKTPRDEIRSEVLPMLYNAFESATIQVQSAALVAVTNVSEYIEDTAIRRMVLPKTKLVYEKNSNDIKIVLNVLSCIEKTLDRLDRTMIIDEVLPILWDVRLQDPEVILRVVCIYRTMMSDKKYGLSINLMATRVMPSLFPQTVNPSLNLELFTMLIGVLQEMLDIIDKHQRNKLKLDNLSLPSPERHRPLRHQMSSDNMHVQPFNIPNLRIEQRKTSSAEDMARKNSTDCGMLGGWWFGAPSSPDSNFLRVHNAFPNRRLSDNQLTMPPKIRIAPSCASSPGGTPGGGLPIRRHSSIGPQERRGSTINLSPPTGGFGLRMGGSQEGSTLSVPSAYGGSMPNTSSSVPFLLNSSMSSLRSRRPSACLSGSQGSGLLQQLGSGMVRQLALGSGPALHHTGPGRVFPSSNVQPYVYYNYFLLMMADVRMTPSPSPANFVLAPSLLMAAMKYTDISCEFSRHDPTVQSARSSIKRDLKLSRTPSKLTSLSRSSSVASDCAKKTSGRAIVGYENLESSILAQNKSQSLPAVAAAMRGISPIYDVLDVSAEDLAAQLTLLDLPVFRAISPDELSSCGWTKRNKQTLAPNVVAFTRRFNHVSFWTVEQVLSRESPKARAEVMMHFIRVAKKLYELSNLHSLFAIISSLQSAPVYRLTKTWNQVSKKERSTFDRLAEVFVDTNNWEKLREHMTSLKLPCIPYLGLFLTDLVYIDMAHPPSEGLESEPRLIKMNNILRIVSSLQQSEYSHLQASPIIQHYLNSVRYIEELQKFVEDDQYKLSLRLEPPSPNASNTASKESILEVGSTMASLNLSPAKGLGGSFRFHAAIANSTKFVPSHRKTRSLGTKFRSSSLPRNLHGSGFQHFRGGAFSIFNKCVQVTPYEQDSPVLGMAKPRHLLDDSEIEQRPKIADQSSRHSLQDLPDLPEDCVPDEDQNLISRSGSFNIDETESHNKQAVLFEGCLRRKTVQRNGRKLPLGGLLGGASWQRYWVQLRGSTMVYFAAKAFNMSTNVQNNDRSQFKREPCKIVPLAGFTVAALNEASDLFHLVDQERGNVYKFRTGNKEMAKEWCRHLHKIISREFDTPLPVNLMSFE